MSIFDSTRSNSKILTNHQIPGAIIDLIEDSKEYCFLVTPYFKSWKLLNRTLAKAAKKEKKIIFIFRAGEGVTDEMRLLNEEYDFDVILVQNLHTKLYLNESKVILSSMNLYDSSKENNYEVGYILDNWKSVRDFKEIIIEDDILSLDPVVYLKGRYKKAVELEGEKARLKEEEKARKEEERNQREKDYSGGYCIRCKSKLRLNTSFPLCNSCYETWSYFNNPYYTESYCHMCGKPAGTSKNRPVCSDCF